MVFMGDLWHTFIQMKYMYILSNQFAFEIRVPRPFYFRIYCDYDIEPHSLCVELCPLENNPSKIISQINAKSLTEIYGLTLNHSLLKKIKGNKTIILNENGKKYITDPYGVAENFNKYFFSTASEIGPPDLVISADEAICTHQNQQV